jgi:hypothetical protein
MKSTTPMRAALLAGRVFIAIGLLIVFVAATQASRSMKFATAGVSAEGTVVQQIRKPGRRPRVRPMVRFATQAGVSIDFTSTESSRYPRYEDGQKVAVVYLPDAPEHAEIDSFGVLWGGPLLMSLAGLVFAVTGVLVLRRRAG